MKQLFTFLLVAISSIIVAQAPQSITYQAIVRNTDGSVMASTSITMTFKIHDVSATGAVVYEETHSTTSNTQGLVSLNVGAGTAVTGTFASINWGAGAKFLHVLMNTGSGNVDLGTQQMMSVPYALYAEKANTTNVSVSAVGDTLYLGNGNYILVPGISNSNKTVDTGLGNQLLPGVTYCADKTISASGCDGLTTLDYQGYTYDLVEIAGQCWFKENLRASSFNDGTPITFEPVISNWNSPTGDIAEQPYYAYYDNSLIEQSNFGNFYNAWCLVNNNICPVGWHVPSVCDTYYLLSKLGVLNTEINNANLGAGGWSSIGIDNLVAQKLFLNEGLDYSSNTQGPYRILPDNSSGFSAKASGMRYNYFDAGKGFTFNMWAIIPTVSSTATEFTFSLQAPGLISSSQNIAGTTIFNSGQNSDPFLYQGRSIRCIKD
ncbi:MAG: hypothetical protein RLY61_787 [Candidatus Parcubacteria bacterium]|jgi:uncharacterized protein (TIGR02145 family)